MTTLCHTLAPPPPPAPALPLYPPPPTTHTHAPQTSTERDDLAAQLKALMAELAALKAASGDLVWQRRQGGGGVAGWVVGGWLAVGRLSGPRPGGGWAVESWVGGWWLVGCAGRTWGRLWTWRVTGLPWGGGGGGC